MFRKFLFVIFFIAAYFAIRMPAYDTPLVGEDGIFSDIFINAPKRPAYGQTARINGITVYNNLGHPSPLYEWLVISGKFFTTILPLKSAAELNSPNLPVYLRFSFSCFQFVAWFLLLIFLLTLPNGKSQWGHLFLLLVLANSPPAIMHSLWLQVDNASGSLLVGLLMSAILMWERHGSSKISFFKISHVLFIAGFASALGKNEWSILVFLSLAATSIFICIRKKKKIETTKEEFLNILYLFAGLVVGNLCSYLFNPVDYMEGLGLLGRMTHNSSLLSTAQSMSWWKVTRMRFSFLYLTLALWVYVSSVFIVKSPWKISVPIVLAFFLSSAFLWSFSLSSWDASDRYFIPAFIALVFSVMMIRTSRTLELDKYLSLIILFLFIDIFNNYLNLFQNHQYRVEYQAELRKSIPTQQGCIHHIEYYAFNLKNIDYVAVGNGPGSLEGHLKATGKKKCE